jgi:uncharacterized membrane protein YdjX (TVP38/TMEM64 family)
MATLNLSPKIDTHRQKQIFQTLFKGIVLLATAWVTWFYRTPLMELLSLVGDREGMIETLSQYDGLGMALLFIILFLQVIVAAIPGHFFMLAGSYLYGFTLGLIIIHTSTVVASQLSYWLARKFGRPIVERLAPAQLLDKWTQKAERQGMAFFFFSFNLPIFPSDVMNFVAGLSGLSPKKFFIANFTGRLPCSIVFALVGASGFVVTPALAIVTAGFTIALFIAWRKLSPRFEARNGFSAS